MTFFVLTCTVAAENAAQNHSDSARNVCRKKAAQIFLVENSQLEDILCPYSSTWRDCAACWTDIFSSLVAGTQKGARFNQRYSTLEIDKTIFRYRVRRSKWFFARNAVVQIFPRCKIVWNKNQKRSIHLRAVLFSVA